MAKLQILAVAALCFALAGVALAHPKFTVEGRVYCDTCRAGFETSLTSYIKGAKVKLECRHFETGKLNYTTEDKTDSTGTYKLKVENNHDEDICEVVLVKSSDDGCSEIIDGRDRIRVDLSQNSGQTTSNRYANPLGFLKKVPLSDCGLLLQQYALGTDE